MPNTNNTDTTSPFGEVIYSYTRAQAVLDGFQIEVSKTATEAGRLWDVLWLLRFAIIRSQPGTSRLTVALYVRNSDTHPPRLTKLIATAGALDIDDPAPAITVLLPDED